MRLDLAMRIASLLATVILLPISIDRDLSPRPRVDRVVPEAAKRGEIVIAAGVNLDRSRVLDLILGNFEQTALTHIVEQSEVSIRFKIPQSLTPGTYRITLALANRWGFQTLEQQPVSLVVLAE